LKGHLTEQQLGAWRAFADAQQHVRLGHDAAQTDGVVCADLDRLKTRESAAWLHLQAQLVGLTAAERQARDRHRP
jgi:hypothetical protein